MSLGLSSIAPLLLFATL
ncbi:rCG50016 [Rattus norvegicus]|uniref:RCG50016 n=1 Tax=Rattus norvegicus TaxID=10116 RepID=A6JVN8_RAT|nr:rCG50016 [Rattus norvegicus]